MNYIFVDTETTNSLDDPLVYDLGITVVNDNQEVLLTKSFVIAEVFLNEELMSSAYFLDKVPAYWQEIKAGTRELRKFHTVKNAIWNIMQLYKTNIVIAHNMYFDYRSTAKTQRYLTCSKYRYFFPYGTEFWDTLKMAREVFGEDKDYIKFCKSNDFMTNHKKPRPRLTAEILYKYITNDLDFIESHTGLEDTLIEKEIFFEVLKIKPDLKGKIFH